MLTIVKKKKSMGRVGRVEATVSAQAPSLILTSARKRNKKRSKKIKVDGATTGIQRYAATLEDPWEHGPLRLGFGTMVPTVTSTGFIRNFVTVPSDGSFAIAAFPSLVNSISVNVGGSGSTTWTPYSCSNYSGIQTALSEARIVSGGLRLFALYPATSKPGVLLAGTTASKSYTSMTANSPTSLSTYASSQIGFGGDGARVVFRPLDLDAFMLQNFILQGYTSTLVPYSSCGYIVGLGFPSGTQVWYEYILNVEGTPSQEPTSAVGIDINAVPDPGLTSFFPSLETLWSATRSLLGNAAVLDGAAGLTELAYPQAGPVIRTVRSSFGRSSNINSATLWDETNRSKQNTEVLHEMKSSETSSGGGWLRL